jgi:hypothetical protein
VKDEPQAMFGLLKLLDADRGHPRASQGAGEANQQKRPVTQAARDMGQDLAQNASGRRALLMRCLTLLGGLAADAGERL